MEKLLFAFTFLCLAGKAQTPFYYYNCEGEKQYFSLNTKFAFLSLRKQQLPADIQQRNNVIAMELCSDRMEQKQYQGKKGANRYYTVLRFEEKLSEEQYLKLLADVKQNNKDVIISPYFKSKSNDKVGLSNFF